MAPGPASEIPAGQLRFAPDSPLEGTGFELPVPREIRFGFRDLVVCPPLRRGGLIDIAGSPNTGSNRCHHSDCRGAPA
jgi:hypothetical protein